MKISPIQITNYKKNSSPSAQIQFEKYFDVRKIENLFCPACASTMFTEEQSSEFCSDLCDARGEELIYAIEKYETMNENDEFTRDLPVFNSRQQEILDRIKLSARKNKNLYLDEIASFLGQDVAKKYGTASTSTILSEYTVPFRNSRPILNDEDYADVFFLNCYNKEYSSYKVAHEFIKNKFPTIEHLVPVSNRGKNEDRNYLCDCSECNRNRGSMPFHMWMNQIPNFEENLQIQIDQINQALKDSRLDAQYKYYPKRVARTIRHVSQGKIDLVV